MPKILIKSFLILVSIFVIYELSYAADYFPLALGNKWVYKGNLDEEMTVKVSGIERESLITNFIVESSKQGKVFQREYFSKQDNNLISTKSIREEGNELEVSYEPANTWLKYPLYVSRVWVESFKERRKGDKFREVALILRTTKVVAEEIISVPAGNFKCYKVEITSENKGGKASNISWYSQGVGIVKMEMFSKTPADSEKITFELKEYSLKK